MDDPLCIENYVGCELTLFLNFASFLRRRYQILQSNCQVQISITTNQKYLSFYKWFFHESIFTFLPTFQTRTWLKALFFWSLLQKRVCFQKIFFGNIQGNWQKSPYSLFWKHCLLKKLVLRYIICENFLLHKHITSKICC